MQHSWAACQLLIAKADSPARERGCAMRGIKRADALPRVSCMLRCLNSSRMSTVRTAGTAVRCYASSSCRPRATCFRPRGHKFVQLVELGNCCAHDRFVHFDSSGSGRTNDRCAQCHTVAARASLTATGFHVTQARATNMLS
jgi:hypothetical protein